MPLRLDPAPHLRGMAKVKTAFFCQNCGAESPKWVGRCPACGEWNTYVEEVIEKGGAASTGGGSWNAFADEVGEGQGGLATAKARKSGGGAEAMPLAQVQAGQTRRMVSGDGELDRVLGGGVVPGSLVLVGGEPGIGKSTLMLQLALRLQGATVLYVSGEESAAQVRLRADRIGRIPEDLLLLTETALTRIFKRIRQAKPALLVIDSIQTLYTELVDAPAGSVTQIKACAGELQRFAKESGTPVFVIGHINKEGAIAGPKVLEHMVDTVLQFEGDRHHLYRILRTVKNRFGSTAELGIYRMAQDGLHGVDNPSELLLGQRDEPVSGVAVACTVEGMRPMLVETQALVSPAVYGTPQRTATGFDLRRLSMLLAVLEKRGGLAFGQRDVFLNIAGGLKVEDPAIDLGVVAALLSSFEDLPLPLDVAFCGEVGLSGEVRAVPRIEQRAAEAAKLGYRRFFLPKHNVKGLNAKRLGIRLEPIDRVELLYQNLFGG